MIRPAKEADCSGLATIYNHYIANTVVTFEEDAVDAQAFQLRLAETAEAGLPWLVADVGGKIAGYAYASKWKGRCAYRFSVEVTVYLSPDFTGQGLGSDLYTALFAALGERSFHAVMGGISLPNAASIALHEKFGMKKVAHFEEVGYKFGRWIDVGYWQGKLSNTDNTGADKD